MVLVKSLEKRSAKSCYNSRIIIIKYQWSDCVGQSQYLINLKFPAFNLKLRVASLRLHKNAFYGASIIIWNLIAYRLDLWSIVTSAYWSAGERAGRNWGDSSVRRPNRVRTVSGYFVHGKCRTLQSFHGRSPFSVFLRPVFNINSFHGKLDTILNNPDVSEINLMNQVFQMKTIYLYLRIETSRWLE